MSAAASWIEAFKLPLREVGMRYTKSDLIIACWDSKLKAYNMNPPKGGKKTINIQSTEYKVTDGYKPREYDPNYNPNGVVETDTDYVLPSKVNNGVRIPKSFFNEEGDVDLRRVPGDVAVRYIRALGINVAPIIKLK